MYDAANLTILAVRTESSTAARPRKTKQIRQQRKYLKLYGLDPGRMDGLITDTVSRQEPRNAWDAKIKKQGTVSNADSPKMLSASSMPPEPYSLTITATEKASV